MNENTNTVPGFETDVRKLIDNIDNVKSTVDLFDVLVEEQFALTAV